MVDHNTTQNSRGQKSRKSIIKEKLVSHLSQMDNDRSINGQKSMTEHQRKTEEQRLTEMCDKVERNLDAIMASQKLDAESFIDTKYLGANNDANNEQNLNNSNNIADNSNLANLRGTTREQASAAVAALGAAFPERMDKIPSPNLSFNETSPNSNKYARFDELYDAELLRHVGAGKLPPKADMVTQSGNFKSDFLASFQQKANPSPEFNAKVLSASTTRPAELKRRSSEGGTAATRTPLATRINTARRSSSLDPKAARP